MASVEAIERRAQVHLVQLPLLEGRSEELVEVDETCAVSINTPRSKINGTPTAVVLPGHGPAGFFSGSIISNL